MEAEAAKALAELVTGVAVAAARAPAKTGLGTTATAARVLDVQVTVAVAVKARATTVESVALNPWVMAVRTSAHMVVGGVKAQAALAKEAMRRQPPTPYK